MMNLDELQLPVRPTVLLEFPRLSERFGIDLVLATETFQYTGSFKFRAAYHLARSVSQSELVAASSGNFGQALAYACALLRKRCTIVMPHDSAIVKVNAVREFGGNVEFVDVRIKTRKQRVLEVAAALDDVYVASAYDDPYVIAGNATLGLELARATPPFDCIVAPIGGGGLTAGLILGLRHERSSSEIIGAEPRNGNDAARSLRAGRILANETEPDTLADGARTLSIGEHNWHLLRDGLKAIVEVPEEKIVEAVRLLFLRANLKVEPTGALAMGALLTDPVRFRGRRICCVISGGNVDPERLIALLNTTSG